MLVTITKSSGDKFWYAKQIGESYHVLPPIKGRHRIDGKHYPESPFMSGLYINTEDCVTIKQAGEKDTYIKPEDKYSYSCKNCDWVFKAETNIKTSCPYCEIDLLTNPFNENDSSESLGTTSVIYKK